MSLTYLDSSALAKRYIAEIGSAWVRRLCVAEEIAISLLSVAELASAFARRTRDGTISPVQRDAALDAFAGDMNSFTVVDVSRLIAESAGTLLLNVPATIRLRTLDALHVVSAQQAFARARRSGAQTGSFVAADRALLTAAAWAGLPVDNPEDYP